MNKILQLLGVVLTLVGAIMFLADYLPVDLLNQHTEDSYLKIVSDNSFSITHYRLHFLVVGIVLVLTSKLKKVVGF